MPQELIYPSTPDINQSIASTVSSGSSKIYTSRLYSESLQFSKNEVSLAAMTFLFQELISQLNNKSLSRDEFETKLLKLGISIGSRLLELLNFRASVSPTSSSRTSTFLSSTSSLSASTNAEVNSTSNTIDRGNDNEYSGTVTDQTNSDSKNESLSIFITKMRRRDLRILDILQFIHGSLWSYLFNHVSDDLVKSSERNNEYMIIDNNPPLTQFISSTNNNVSCDYFVCGIINGFLNNAGFQCNVTAHLMPQNQFEKRTVYLIKFRNEVLERENLRF